MGGGPGGRSCPGGAFCRVPAPALLFPAFPLAGLAFGLLAPIPQRFSTKPWESHFQRHIHPGQSSAPAPSVAPCGFQGPPWVPSPEVLLPLRAVSGRQGLASWVPVAWSDAEHAHNSLQALGRPPLRCTHPPRLAHVVQALGADLLNGKKCRSALRPPP